MRILAYALVGWLLGLGACSYALGLFLYAPQLDDHDARIKKLERREAHLRARLQALCADYGHGESSIIIVRGHVRPAHPTGCAPLP